MYFKLLEEDMIYYCCMWSTPRCTHSSSPEFRH